jgi:hypothetical protein
MKGTTHTQVLVQTSEAVTAGQSALSPAATAALAAAVPITILVIVVCALAWRSVGLPPAGQEHTLELLDRLTRLARALWPGSG